MRAGPGVHLAMALFSFSLVIMQSGAAAADPAYSPCTAPALGTTINCTSVDMPNGASAQKFQNGVFDYQQSVALAASASKNKFTQPKADSAAEKKDKSEHFEPASSSADMGRNQFQEFLFQSMDRKLPIFGLNLFSAPSTFAPLDNVPVTADYPIGPGDEIVLHTWGAQLDLDFQLTVDRDGGIDIPRVGRVSLAGVKYSELHGVLKKAISKSFRNFDLNVSMGRLRSIQVYVVGQARRPGVYTVSSLSTLVNTLFASGGPSVTGSMRHIQIKRGDKVVAELDMYDLLIHGDKSRDMRLLPGDVIYIPPVGKMAAITGSVNNEAIYELKGGGATLAELIELAGGMTTVASDRKARVERIDDHKVRQVDEFALDEAGLKREVQDGDLVEINAVNPHFGNAVTLRGNVASPGRYPWQKGMRVRNLIPDMDSLIVPGYWENQNQIFRVTTNEQNLHRETVGHTRAEINWDYAVIERLNKSDLTTVLIPFDLGKAIENKDAPENMLLEEGDVITIFSKGDMRVPVAKQSAYIRLEGEVKTPGVYKALPGETLRQLVERLGGLTPNAYLFGAELDRESTRVMQQRRLQEMADRMQAEIERILVAKQQSALSPEDAAAAKQQAEAQLELVRKMRGVKASGRVVLEIPPQSVAVKDLPDVVLEDGDRFFVPSKPSVVSVMGMVYNENVFVYHSGAEVSSYLDKAGGPTRDADVSRIYLLRADGSVVSAQSGGAFFNRFLAKEVIPGDTLVVPEMLDRLALTKELKDWTQIFYQFALTVVGLKVLGL
jgi:protein involved in polysaccharide export with SLBB domain